MNRFAIITLLLMGPVVLQGLTSCDTCNPTPYRFGVTDFRLYPRRLASSSYNYYLTDTLASNDTVSFEQLELILVGQERTVALNKGYNSGFSAFACSPTSIPADSINSLSISSDQPYTRDTSNKDLSALLTIGQGNYDQRTLANFTTSVTQSAFSFYSLQFRQPPNQAGWYSFKGSIELKSGRRYDFASRQIFIRK